MVVITRTNLHNIIWVGMNAASVGTLWSVGHKTPLREPYFWAVFAAGFVFINVLIPHDDEVVEYNKNPNYK